MSKEKQHIDQSSPEKTMHDQKDLLERCARADSHAQKELYDLYAAQMYAVCLRYSKSTQEAEDIMQEAYIKVFKSIKTFRGDSKLVYWIKRIVINTALNHQRSKLYKYPMHDIDDFKQDIDYENVLSSYQFDELLAMIRTLPDGCQTVFNLYAIEGYSHKEIGEMLKISEGTSKSQFSRARKLLQKMIAEDNKKIYEDVRE